MQSDTLGERCAIKFYFKNITETYGMLQTDFRPSCWNWASYFEWHKRLLEGRASVRDDERCGGVMKSIHQSWLAKGWVLGLGLLCWGFKGVQEEISSEEASSLQIGSVAFPTGQYTSPQLHPCHRLRQSFTLPIIQTLLTVTFWLFPKLRGLVMRQLRRWKRLWRRSLKNSHKRTSIGPSRSCWNGTTCALQPEEINSKGTRISCEYYQ